MRNTIAVVSLEQIVKNAELVKEKAGVPLIAVVKDDGYGHGAGAVAHALEKIASAFTVASVEEGAALRAAGISKQILVLTPPICKEDALRLSGYRLTATVASAFSLRVIAEAKCKEQIDAHLAVNTGMNRYGFPPEKIEAVCKRAPDCIRIAGVYSHFYAPEDAEAREEQYRRFSEAAKTVRAYFPEAVRHLSATGGILAGRKYAFDAVRCGIALYGYLPAGFEGKLNVKPAMKVYAAVAQSGKFSGGGAGYARADRKYGDMYTLKLGYGDGFFRKSEIGIGNLCMDACVCAGRAKFGAWKQVFCNAESYAKQHGTIAYEALVNIGGRAVKIYV